MNWVNYGMNFESSRFWKIVLTEIQPWRRWIDVYSIDCIRLHSTDEVLGLWSPYKNRETLREIITHRLDSYPAWGRYQRNEQRRIELEEAVRGVLFRIANKYIKIVSFVNVKAYHKCLFKLSSEFGIVALPRKVDWKAARAVPHRNLHELKETLNGLNQLMCVQEHPSLDN
jgi:hypothetical protein